MMAYFLLTALLILFFLCIRAEEFSGSSETLRSIIPTVFLLCDRLCLHFPLFYFLVSSGMHLPTLLFPAKLRRPSALPLLQPSRLLDPSGLPGDFPECSTRQVGFQFLPWPITKYGVQNKPNGSVPIPSLVSPPGPESSCPRNRDLFALKVLVWNTSQFFGSHGRLQFDDHEFRVSPPSHFGLSSSPLYCRKPLWKPPPTFHRSVSGFCKLTFRPGHLGCAGLGQVLPPRLNPRQSSELVPRPVHSPEDVS